MYDYCMNRTPVERTVEAIETTALLSPGILAHPQAFPSFNGPKLPCSPLGGAHARSFGPLTYLIGNGVFDEGEYCDWLDSIERVNQR